MDAILLAISVILFVQLIFVLWNLSTFPTLKGTSDTPTLQPRISVLIPARNEEKNITACLDSVVKQTFTTHEIVVLNDHSTDQTASFVEKFNKSEPTVRLLEGEDLPDGWMGKSFACQQLADHAQGDWFLFLDADARLEKDALAKLIPLLDKQKGGIISGFPRQVVRSWMEKLVVTMMQFVIICHLPIRYVQKAKSPLFAAAHGGFIVVERNSYQKIGGHAAIRASLLDDIQLMKQFKSFGYPATLAKIDSIVHMRMYENAKQVWLGYQKNLFAGLNRSGFLFASIFSYYSFLYLLPWFTLLFGGSMLYVGLVYGLGALTKVIIDLSNRVFTLASLLIPISVVLMLAISTDSLLRSYQKRGYEWKGRRYF